MNAVRRKIQTLRLLELVKYHVAALDSATIRALVARVRHRRIVAKVARLEHELDAAIAKFRR